MHAGNSSNCGQLESFEYSEGRIIESNNLKAIIVYRPPYSADHMVPMNVFLDEFSSYRAFSLSWPATMQIYETKIRLLHRKRVQPPRVLFGTPTWPPFHCFGTPMRPP